MAFTEPHYRTSRPLNISILGAAGVGKTSVALQYVTGQVAVETSPTTIEDVFRKEARMTVLDEDILLRIQDSLKNRDVETEVLLEEPYNKQEEANWNTLESADISLSMKITDTAGYVPAPKEANTSTRNFLSRLTLKKNRDQIITSLPTTKKPPAGGMRFRNSPSVSVSVRAKDRHAVSMLSCDGVVLVYNILDEKSFATAREIRNRFVQMRQNDVKHSRRARSNSVQGVSHKLRFGCCGQSQSDNIEVPPIFLIGTHSDVRAENIMKENSSHNYDVSFLHPSDNRAVARHGVKKRKVVRTPTEQQGSVHSDDVYQVISEWKECVGFAEITSHDTSLVEQIFEQLNRAIIIPKEN